MSPAKCRLHRLMSKFCSKYKTAEFQTLSQLVDCEEYLMNQQWPQHQMTNVGLIICLLLTHCLGGCGSKSDGPSVVTPPPSEQQKATPLGSHSTDDAPGKLVLPEGDLPHQPATDQPGGGLELPDDATHSDAGNDKASIQYATWDEIEKFATSTGRVTVVDIWSTVCAPCLKEFPGLVKLHTEHGDRIQCVSVDVDYDGRKSKPPESYEEAIVAVLTSFGATFPNYVSKTPSEDIFLKLNVVSIPAVLIFDKEGKLVKRFIDADDTAGFSYEKDIIPLVTKLAG